MSTLIERDQHGVERCRRIIKAVVPNDPKNPTEGFKQTEAYCNKPMLVSISHGGKLCPDCDKQPPVGWVNPRITNSAGVVLTSKELEECGATAEAPQARVPVKSQKSKEPKKAMEAKMKPAKNAVTIVVTLQELEQSEDVVAVFLRCAIAAMDKLPTPTLAESKRLIKLQEKLTSLLGV